MELKRKNKLLYILGAILIVLCAVITPFMFNKHNGVYARGTDGNYYYTDFFNDSWSCSFSSTDGYTSLVDWDQSEWGILGSYFYAPFGYGDVALKTQTRLKFSTSNNNYVGLDLILADNILGQIKFDLSYNTIDDSISYSFASGVRLINLGTNTAYFCSMSLDSDYFSVSEGSDYCRFTPTNYLGQVGNDNSTYPYVTFLTYNTGNSTASFNSNNIIGVSYGNNVAVASAVNNLSTKYQYINGVQQSYNSNTITQVLTSSTCVDYFTSDGCHLVLFHNITFETNDAVGLFLNSYYPFRGTPITYYYADGSSAYSTGYNDGYADGDSDGYTRGYNAGYSAGESAGYSAGYTAGYNAGYTAGESAGETAGYQDGYTAGETAGYQDGYADGVDTAQDTAYQSGYNAGQSAGYANGYDYGYDVGYVDGKADNHVGAVNPDDVATTIITDFSIDSYTTYLVTDSAYSWNTDGVGYPTISYNYNFDIFFKGYDNAGFVFGLGSSNPNDTYYRDYYVANGTFYNVSANNLVLDSNGHVVTSAIASLPNDFNLDLGDLYFNFGSGAMYITDNLDFYGALVSGSGTNLNNISSGPAYCIPYNIHVTDGFNGNVYYYYYDNVVYNTDLQNLFYGSTSDVRPITYHFVCFNGATFNITFYIRYPQSSVATSQNFYVNKNITLNGDYSAGYSAGQSAGIIEGDSLGYDRGYSYGYYVGKNDGYVEGIDDANDYSFIGLIGATIDAPVKALTGLLNFEILGVNLSAFVYGLFSITLVIIIIRKIKGGR